MLIAGSAFGFNVPATEQEVKPIVEEVKLTIEEQISLAFPEVKKEMLLIAKCESGNKLHPHGRQFNEDGTVLISKTSDIGIFQINQVHWPEAEELNIDIKTIEGNIEFAKLLYQRSGFKPWYMSNNCHQLL